MLARKPLGGSFVTLTEFCKTETGKDFDGIELRYSLKAGLIFDESSDMFCIIRSMGNIQEVAKWQF